MKTVFFLTFLITIAGRNHYGYSSYIVWWCCWLPMIAAFLAPQFKWQRAPFVKNLLANSVVYIVWFHSYHDWGANEFVSAGAFWLVNFMWITIATMTVHLEILNQERLNVLIGGGVRT